MVNGKWNTIGRGIDDDLPFTIHHLPMKEFN